MLEEFGLTLEQTRIMFSLEYQLVNSDRHTETDFGKSILKTRWLSEWKNSTELFLQNETKKENHPIHMDRLITDWLTVTYPTLILRIERGLLKTS